MNKKVIIGNFKMNLLPNEVVLYIENLKEDIKSSNEIVLCVPYVNIPYINNNLKKIKKDRKKALQKGEGMVI